jgi:pimeloyl-ACP methyl ester carboxylesterase
MQPILDSLEPRIGTVLECLNYGKYPEAAEIFVDQVALGPGTWARLPEPTQATFIRNAETFMGETRDPDGNTIDLDTLGRFNGPVLLSQGDQSPPMFPAVIERLRAALPRARHHVFPGARHVPHLTHPQQFVDTLTSFLAS